MECYKYYGTLLAHAFEASQSVSAIACPVKTAQQLVLRVDCRATKSAPGSLVDVFSVRSSLPSSNGGVPSIGP